jgi:D-alanyl-D-alanine carboxypeptidase
MAVATIDLDQIVVAATGLRIQGGTDQVTDNDSFHLGSVAKSMTSTVAASLVRDGLISWETRMVDVLPELATSARAVYRGVTLGQLLQHRSGLPAFGLFSDLDAVPPSTGSAPERRRAFATWVVTQAAETNLDTFGYSNAGYVVATAMLEQAAGESWESLIGDRVFEPLELETAGLGWPAAGAVPAPIGHYSLDGVTLVAHDDAGEQFPDLMSPAGNVSMSIGDFGRYVQAHLRGMAGRDDLLPAAAIEALHTSTYPEIVPGASYAFGWVTTVVDGVRADAHNGSADTFFALMVVQPDRGRAVVAVANAATERVDAELTALVDTLVEP